MRARTAILVTALGIWAIARVAAAQMSEESVAVPTSRETREAESAASAAAAAQPAEGERDAAADWRAVAAPYDIERIEANEKAYGEALESARAAGSPADRAELARVLATLPRPIDPATLPGRWQCRTIRIGAEPPRLAVYGWFDCQIAELSAGLLLEKLSGSELSSGYLYPDSETRMIYLGHRHGRDEPARDYDGPAGPTGADPANRDDPAILTARGPDRLLLARPYPTLPDADYDLLEMRRP